MPLVPGEYVNRIRELYGRQGDEWLQALPALLDQCADRFGVSLDAPFSDLSWNLIIKAAKYDSMPVVLKIGIQREELFRELRVLNVYAGHGAIRVLDFDENSGALLLERAEPGTPLSVIENDQAATEIFCDVFQCLQGRPPAGQYPTLKEHFSGIEGYRLRFIGGGVPDPLPNYWVERAEECLAYLIESTQENELLHGDLHHTNILRHKEKEWVAIDPKGIVGDRHFDAIQYLLNYEDRGGDPFTVLTRRLAIIADRLKLDSRRIAMWGVARGVLEACWSLENGKADWLRGVQLSERFAKYLDLAN